MEAIDLSVLQRENGRKDEWMEKRRNVSSVRCVRVAHGMKRVRR